jgi:hypothetical protein
MAPMSCTVVRCFSKLALATKLGIIALLSKSLNKACEEMGMNWETVVMARLRTTGREWDSSGGRTLSGCGVKVAFERLFGKRLIRIERMERVSTRVSGGVLGC